MLLMVSIRPALAASTGLSLLFPGVTGGTAIGMKPDDLIPPRIAHAPLTAFAAGVPARTQAMMIDNAGTGLEVMAVGALLPGGGDGDTAPGGTVTGPAP